VCVVVFGGRHGRQSAGGGPWAGAPARTQWRRLTSVEGTAQPGAASGRGRGSAQGPEARSPMRHFISTENRKRPGRWADAARMALRGARRLGRRARLGGWITKRCKRGAQAKGQGGAAARTHASRERAGAPRGNCAGVRAAVAAAAGTAGVGCAPDAQRLGRWPGVRRLLWPIRDGARQSPASCGAAAPSQQCALCRNIWAAPGNNGESVAATALVVRVAPRGRRSERAEGLWRGQPAAAPAAAAQRAAVGWGAGKRGADRDRRREAVRSRPTLQLQSTRMPHVLKPS
jgi:hypothetical protein